MRDRRRLPIPAARRIAVLLHQPPSGVMEPYGLEPINALTPSRKDGYIPHSPLQEHEPSVHWVMLNLSFPRCLYYPFYATNGQTGQCGWLLPLSARPVDIDASGDSKNFIGSTNGSLASFLGIPFAKPPYALTSVRLCHALTPV